MSSRFDSNWNGFCNRGREHLVAAVGCAYKAWLGVLWCVGVTVIVHSCMHNEHQPSAGFILDHPFLLDFFSLLATLSTFKNKKRGSGCSQEKLCTPGKGTELCWIAPKLQKSPIRRWDRIWVRSMSPVLDQQRNRKPQLWLLCNPGRLCYSGLTPSVFKWPHGCAPSFIWKEDMKHKGYSWAFPSCSDFSLSEKIMQHIASLC